MVNGVREWELVAEEKEIEVAPGVKYAAWAYNGRVPGPTLRAREGERLRIRFTNGSKHPHTIHFHGIHPSSQDGIAGLGAGNVDPGKSTTYEFHATPFGLHLYHCHTMPLAEHIAKGLYGAFIIDPKQGRPAADELVMVMNGFDTNFDRSNEVYAVNTVAFDYMHRPVRVKRGELVRIYLVNAARVRPPELVPHPRQLLRLLPDRHAPRAARLHRHGRPGAGRARHSRAALPVHRQVHVPRARERVRGARLDGLLPSRGVMEPATAQRTRRPAWLAGVAPLAVLAVAIGLFVLLDAPGLEPDRRAAGEAGRRAHRAEAGRDPAARAQRRRGPRAGEAGDRERRVRRRSTSRRTRSAAWAAPRSTSSTHGSRARTTTCSWSPRPARRSTTRSRRRSRRPTRGSTSTG